MYCRENAYSWRERVIRPIFIWKMRKSLKKSIRQKRSSNLQKRALAPYSRVVLKLKIVKLCLDCYWFLFWKSTFRIRRSQIAQSSLSSKYLRKCKYAYSILQNQYLWIYEDSFWAKILRDDCAQSFEKCLYATFEIIVQFLTNYVLVALFLDFQFIVNRLRRRWWWVYAMIYCPPFVPWRYHYSPQALKCAVHFF